METIATSVPVKSSSQPAKIDWPILTFWLTYFSMVFGILYAFISEGF
jgi:uncharacterized membrane protein